MQPTPTSRPVMDVTARRPAVATAAGRSAPSAAMAAAVSPQDSATAPAGDTDSKTRLSVREAPAPDDAKSPTPASAIDTDAPSAAAESAQHPDPSTSRASNQPAEGHQPRQTASNGQGAPVGAIVSAVVVMLALSAIAIAIYIKA